MQASPASVNNTYATAVEYVLERGFGADDRTGVGTISAFGWRSEYALSSGKPGEFLLPIITLKKVHIPSVVHELLWMLSGSTNVRYLQDNKIRIWNEWADEKGELGPVYGSQWRNFNGEGIDQIKRLEDSLRNNPRSRRHILTAWNPVEVDNMALPPCHMTAQFFIDNQNRLHCQMYQRSADLFLGVPFNILQYSLLTAMLARVLDLGVGKLSHVMGDFHIYSNHLEQVTEMLTRDPKYTAEGTLLTMPKLMLPKRESVVDYRFEDFQWSSDYTHHPHLAGKVAV